LIRNKDVLYTSNAPAVEVAKLLNYIRLITATVTIDCSRRITV